MCSQEKIQQALETISSELGKRQLSASAIQDYRSNRRLRPLALWHSYMETNSFNPACH